MDKVKWVQGDANSPETYREDIRDADLVVHSVGILLEADYKPVVHSKNATEALSELSKKVSTAGHPQNPFDDKPRRITYDEVNRQSGTLL
jgi:uncharacterized protein YbjT (DUF2867 family)